MEKALTPLAAWQLPDTFVKMNPTGVEDATFSMKGF